MSQATTWGAPRVADAPVTPTDNAIRIDESLDALLTSHSGASRPAYAAVGTIWHDTDSTTWHAYDGTNDLLIPTEKLASNTALADAAATMTATELVGGLFTITPTTARILTTATAVLILAELPYHTDGSNFLVTIVNNAAFNVTVAAGTDVTLVGDMVLNNESGTFMIYRTSGTAVTMVRM